MNSLYITYDGLLDPLGKSQILPYIEGIVLRDQSISFFILSFEKHYNYELIDQLKEKLAKKSIIWKPLRFSQNSKIFSKFLDLVKMYFFGFLMRYKHQINIVHARGHPAAMVARLLKLLTNTKFLFDFRGFWADERIDKGGWDTNLYFDLLQYKTLKFIERRLIKSCDQMIVLSKKGKSFIVNSFNIEASKITVIPCAADYAHFRPIIKNQTLILRNSMNILEDDIVLGYSGTIGKMYLLDETFSLFSALINANQKSKLLVLTNNKKEFEEFLILKNYKKFENKIIVKNVDRNEMPRYLCCMDFLVTFVKPTFSKIAASSTRNAEAFACGLPVIANSGVGDNVEIFNEFNPGILIEDIYNHDFANTISAIFEKSCNTGTNLVNITKDFYSLDSAVLKYQNVYQAMR